MGNVLRFCTRIFDRSGIGVEFVEIIIEIYSFVVSSSDHFRGLQNVDAVDRSIEYTWFYLQFKNNVL